MSVNQHSTNFLIVLLLFFIGSIVAKNEINHLDKILDQTALFFDKLKVQFGSLPAKNDTLESINTEVNGFLKGIYNNTRQRSRRQLFQQNNYEKDYGVLSGFETLPSYKTIIATDVHFFMRRGRDQLTWFIATINPDGVYLLQLFGDSYIPVFSFPLKNGKSILTDSRDSSTLLIIQQHDGAIRVLRLSINAEEKLVISQAPTIPSINAKHAAIWTGMNQLYLGVTFTKMIKIYVWLGENFDQIQSLDFGAEKLVPLQTGGSMSLAATGKTTRIITFQLKSNKFLVSQELKGSKDAAGFLRDDGYFGEQYLVLADDNSTIIYKEKNRGYVPFQKLPGTNVVQALSSDQKILLFFVEKTRGMRVYQHDGWRFADSKIYAPRVTRVYSTFLLDGSFVLVMKNVDNEWSFKKMIWNATKTWATVKEGLMSWCEDSLASLKPPPVIPRLKHPLVMTKARIHHLSASRVNGKGAEKFVNVTRTYKKMLLKLDAENRGLEEVMSLDAPVFENFSAKKVQVMSKVTANRTQTTINHEFIEKLRNPGQKNRNLTFSHVKTRSLNTYKCPIPAIRYKEVNVTGLLNGIIFDSLVKDTLKTNEKNQMITGSFSLQKLITESANLNLDVASNSTRQELSFEELKVDELSVSSGFLLPLDGDEVTMTGDLIAEKVKVSGLIHLRGPMRGAGALRLSPFIDVTEPLVLKNDYFLDNVKIVDFLEVEDLIGPNGESYEEIRSNILPLDSAKIPMHMKFMQKNVEWRNVTLRESFGNWISTDSGLNVTAKKFLTNLSLPDSLYDALPLPIVSADVCAVAVLTGDVYMTNITMNSAFVTNLNVDNVSGALEMTEVFSDSAEHWEEVPWELKSMTGQVTVKNASILSAANIDLHGLQKSMGRWSEPGVLRGPVRVGDVRAKDLITEKGFTSPVPRKIRRFEALKNLEIKRINGVNVREFMGNVVRLDDMISLTNITFTGSLLAEEIIASKTNIDFTSSLIRHFGSKTVINGLKTEDLVLPDLLPLPEADVPVELIINGDVSFIEEPIIRKINKIDLEELGEDIWMKNKPAKLMGSFIFLKNASFEGSIDVLESLETPEYGPWSKLSSKIFSKSLDQEISEKIVIGSLHVPKIMGSENSRVISSAGTALHELEHLTLKKGGNQTISSSLQFGKVVVKDGIKIEGLINDLNLEKDVVRKDSKNNVTGKIIVDVLTVRSLDGYGFNEFAKNSLKTTNQQDLVVIKGKKTFENLKIKRLNLTSTIGGKNIEACLLKHSRQVISGRKVIRGKLKAPEIGTEGLINDVDLTKLIVYQLKKNSPRQVIETPIVLQGGLKVLGDLTVDKPIRGVDLRSLERSLQNSSIVGEISGLKKCKNLSEIAENIEFVLKKRAFYFDKLEFIEKNSTPILEVPVDETVKLNLLGICKIREFRFYCNNHEIIDFGKILNVSEILEMKIVTVEGRNLIVCITSASNGGVLIYSVDEEKRGILKEAELLIPDVIKASVIAYMKSVWIVLEIRDYTVVLRYDSWNEFQDFVIPGSSSFSLSSSPSGELLLFRNDGVWRLGGAAEPRLLFRANLKGEIDVYVHEMNLYVQLNEGNVTNLLKAHYVGN